MLRRIISGLMFIIAAQSSANTELFNGKHTPSEVAGLVCNKNFSPEYPELFRIALWQNGDLNKRTEIVGKWSDLDTNGEASYSQAKVKVSINKISAEETAWNIKVTPASGYGVYSVKYPELAVPVTADPEEKLLWPFQSGIALTCPSKIPDKQAGNRPRLKNAIWAGTYGDKFQSLQMIIYTIGQSGFMLWTQDPEGYIKDFTVSKSDVSGSLQGKAMLFAVYHFPSNTGMPGAAWEGQYPTITTSFSDGWYQAAKRYREWAVKQWWCKNNTIARRLKDGRLDSWFGRNSMWTTCCDYKSGAKVMEKLSKEFPETEIGVFLTMWQKWDFDSNLPEYFPPRDDDGYKKLIAMKSARMHMFPYMNVNLIDIDYPKSVEEFKDAYLLPLPKDAMAPDNGKSAESYIERWGKIEEKGVVRKRFLQPVCRTTAKWHDTWLGLSNHNLQDYGTDGQYVDQLVAAVYPCWSKNHGHLPGFGPYWLRSSRKILEDIRQANPGKILYCENINEIYIGTVEDVYGAFPEYYKYNVIPMFQAVYHEYVSLHEWYIMPETLKDPRDFAQVLSESIHIGFKPGSFFTAKTIAELIKPENRQAMDFLKAVEKALRQTIMVSLYGERLADPVISGSPEHEISYWKDGKATRVKRQTVTGSCWRSVEQPQQTMLLLTNTGNREVEVQISSRDFSDGIKIKDLQGGSMVFKQGMNVKLSPLSVNVLITE